MEELGLDIPFKFIFKMTPEEKNDKAFHSVFLGHYDGRIDYNEEVAEVRWFEINELKKMIKDDPRMFTPQFLVGINKYFSADT